MASVTFPVSLGGDGSTVTDDASPTTGLANGGHRTRFVPALSQFVAVANGGVTQATTQVGLATTQASNASASATLASQWAVTLNSLVAGTDYSAREWAVGTTVPGGSAKTWAQSALNAPGTSATSTTMLSIGTGTRSLTLAQTGKSFVVGQYIALVSTSDPSLSLSFVDGTYAVDDTTSTAPNWMVGVITAFTAGTGAMTVNVTHTGGAGTMASWTVAPAAPPNLPSQTGSANKVLKTNGSAAFWDYEIAAPTVVSGTSQAMVAGGHYIFTNTGAVTTGTLPPSPVAGDTVVFENATGRYDLIIARNGSNIMGLAEDINPFNLLGAFTLRFSGNATLGWRFT